MDSYTYTCPRMHAYTHTVALYSHVDTYAGTLLHFTLPRVLGYITYWNNRTNKWQEWVRRETLAESVGAAAYVASLASIVGLQKPACAQWAPHRLLHQPVLQNCTRCG
jgi:hypothetical protein